MFCGYYIRVFIQFSIYCELEDTLEMPLNKFRKESKGHKSKAAHRFPISSCYYMVVQTH